MSTGLDKIIFNHEKSLADDFHLDPSQFSYKSYCVTNFVAELVNQLLVSIFLTLWLAPITL